jgi:glycerophosphoryl diester phosphodiesterase
MPPFIIAHRGDSAHRPENTLAAFASALEVGADLVEFDVQLTRDSHVIILHDPTLDRTTTGRGRVAEHTLAEVRALSAGYPQLWGSRYAGERVPTLAEALGFLRERGRVMIEIKMDAVTQDAEGGIEARTIDEVRRAGMEKDAVLISFSRTALLRCRQQAPDIMRGHLFHEGTPTQVVEGARAVGCELVMPEKSLLSLEMRDRCREAGLKVASWVIDDPEELLALRSFDLYGVGSNRPGVLLQALTEDE